MNIIKLDEYRPHLSGEIKCFNCGYKWHGISLLKEGKVLPVECPKCKKMYGFFIYPILPNENEIIYECKCGGELFYILKYGIRCIRCGLLHKRNL